MHCTTAQLEANLRVILGTCRLVLHFWPFWPVLGPTTTCEISKSPHSEKPRLGDPKLPFRGKLLAKGFANLMGKIGIKHGMKKMRPEKGEIARSSDLPIRLERNAWPCMAGGRRDSTGAKLSAWNAHRRRDGPILGSTKPCFGRPLRVPKRPTQARKKMSDEANPSPLTAQAPNYPRGGAAKALSGPKVKDGSPLADYLKRLVK